MIPIRGLDHVVVRVADLERSLAFYRDALGLPIERQIEQLGLVQLRAGDALIDLVPVDSPLGQAGGGPPNPEAKNVDHFALCLERFDEAELRDLFARHRIPASETAERYGAEGTGPSIYLTDPDGNTVELKGPARPGTRLAQPVPTLRSSGDAALDATRRALLEAAREMDRAGLTEGSAGNLSARTRDGRIVLTPTAMRYAEMTADDLVVVDASGRILAGHRAPTTELALHLACLNRFPEIGAVAHTHPVQASMFAVVGRPIECAIEETLIYLGGDVPVAAYHRTGTEKLARAVASLLADRAAALLSNHGLVVVAGSPAEAIELTRLVERAATIMAGAERLGSPLRLPGSIRAEFAASYLERRCRARTG